MLSIGNKAKHRINSKVQINVSLNMCICLFRLVVTQIVGTLYGRGGMKRFKNRKREAGKKRLRTTALKPWKKK